jgi:hypothetical protein
MPKSSRLTVHGVPVKFISGFLGKPTVDTNWMSVGLMRTSQAVVGRLERASCFVRFIALCDFGHPSEIDESSSDD